MIRRPPRSPLFPYTTPFRSHRPELDVELLGRRAVDAGADEVRRDEVGRELQPHPRPADDARQRLDGQRLDAGRREDRKSTRLNSSHANISYAVFCLKKKKIV